MSAETHESTASPPESEQAADNLYTRTVRAATQNVKLLTIYFTAVAASVSALLFLGDSHQLFIDLIGKWILPFGVAIALAPLGCTFCLQTLPAWLERRRAKKLRDWSLSHDDIPTGYFRIGPYEDTKEDRARFSRADDEHNKVLEWITNSKLPILFLTGSSGTGKSSLLNAFVIPELRDASPPVRTITVRSFDVPLNRLVEQVLTPGVIWQQPPKRADDDTPLTLLTKACRYLDGRKERLLLVFDQFEELVILNDTESSRAQDVREFLKEIQSSQMEGLTVLLSVRSDYAGLLSEFGLPPLQEGTNWRNVNPFSLAASREFLQRGFPDAGPSLIDAVFTEANAIEETKGLIRPITLNMLGQVVQRAGEDLTHAVSKGKLLENDLRRCLDTGEIKDHARQVLKPMLSKAGTKRPCRIDELSSESGLDQHVVEGCLLHLNFLGLVRRINRDPQLAARIWEVSHDFVARLLFGILVHKRTSVGQYMLRGAAGVALAAWAVMFLVLLPDYRRRAPDRASFQLQQDYQFVVSVNPETGGRVVIGSLYPGGGDGKQVSLEEVVPLLSHLGSDLELALTWDWLTDVDALSKLTSMRRLDLGGCTSLTSVDGLRGLTELDELSLNGCTALTDLNGLRGLTQLRELELAECTSLTDVDDLQELHGLRTLNLRGCSSLTDVNGLRGLTDLQKLDLSACMALSDVNGLQSLTHLSELDLSHTAVINLDSLHGMTSLHTLKLDDCRRLTNLDGMHSLTGLQMLGLNNCRSLTDVDGLNELRNLSTIQAGGLSEQTVAAIRERLPNVVIDTGSFRRGGIIIQRP